MRKERLQTNELPTYIFFSSSQRVYRRMHDLRSPGESADRRHSSPGIGTMDFYSFLSILIPLPRKPPDYCKPKGLPPTTRASMRFLWGVRPHPPINGVNASSFESLRTHADQRSTRTPHARPDTTADTASTRCIPIHPPAHYRCFVLFFVSSDAVPAASRNAHAKYNSQLHGAAPPSPWTNSHKANPV